MGGACPAVWPLHVSCGGMGAAFKVTVRDRSARALKLALPMASGEGDVFLKEAMARHGGETFIISRCSFYSSLSMSQIMVTHAFLS